MTLPARGARASMIAAAAFAATLTAAGASQASVHYTFELIGDGPVLGSFTYTAADFITADINVPPAGLDSCTPAFGGTCKAQEFHVSTVGFASGPIDFADVVGFGLQFPSSGSTSFHYFANGAFGAVGVYVAGVLDGDNSRLTVTKDAGPGIPEPATWALLLAGFGLSGVALRARRHEKLSA